MQNEKENKMEGVGDIFMRMEYWSPNIKNRAAYHDYTVVDKIECGIVLEGREVNSIRLGKCNLKGSWCSIENGECFIKNMHISPYQVCNAYGENLLRSQDDPYRVRKLLLHKNEIRKLENKCGQKGFTLIPLELYFSKGKVKILMGLCKGKKLYDKRETEKKREVDRELHRRMLKG